MHRRDMLGLSATLVGGAVALRPRESQFKDSISRPKIVLSDTNDVLETTAGSVRGYTEDGVHTFKGIPYGSTTAGASRFSAARKPAAWAGVRDCLRYGPICPQSQGRHAQTPDHIAFLFDGYYELQEEDCLRLNVWSPGLGGAPNRPVLVWLHGGGFFGGSGSEFPAYDGRNLAARGDVVVVSINHRLNVLGFLNLSEFGERYADSANVGMLDVVAALGWVRQNIERFGGNPENVTVFGQSGGGAKVNYLMVMPQAKGLFHRVVVMSAIPKLHEFQNAEQTAARGVGTVHLLSSNRRRCGLSWDTCGADSDL